jgi:uncharacterized membrane protein YfcA
METVLLFVIVGFIAQIVDGALGMAYGVSSNTLLLTLGLAPAAASAAVHTAEVFTSGVSGFSHWRLGNFNKRLFLILLVPGIIGGFIGAYLLVSIPGSIIKPFVAAYLFVMGVLIFVRALRGVTKSEPEVTNRLGLLALAGGFFDAIGGGGWGPVVTSSLVANGHHPRYSIGTVNLAEFFVTLVQVLTFIATIGLANWPVILGLMIGGGLAAPLAAYVCKKVPPRALMFMVGGLIVLLSIRTFIMVF